MNITEKKYTISRITKIANDTIRLKNDKVLFSKLRTAKNPEDFIGQKIVLRPDFTGARFNSIFDAVLLSCEVREFEDYQAYKLNYESRSETQKRALFRESILAIVAASTDAVMLGKDGMEALTAFKAQMEKVKKHDKI